MNLEKLKSRRRWYYIQSATYIIPCMLLLIFLPEVHLSLIAISALGIISYGFGSFVGFLIEMEEESND